MQHAPRRLLAMLALITIAGAPTTASAKCDAKGGLLFLGKTTESGKSVWLSGTSPGDFKLEAAQGNQTVDTWAKSKRGLHLTLSPVVSNGNGGTHKLFDTGGGKDCLLDTQNQKGGFNIPPIGDLFPDFNGQMPTRPGRPPQGIMPTLPGGVVPPIGALPPQGIMPTLPGQPPQGLMPTMPGGVTPPVGTLPPQGPTPTLPGTVTPPIATLPPEGVTPTVPAAPGGVTPPVSGGAGAAEDVGMAVPLTPGREFGLEPFWNIWSDATGTDVSDQRHGLDNESQSGSVTFGADRRIGDDLVVGFMFGYQASHTDGFDGTWSNDSEGFILGPYGAFRLSPNWAIEASISFSQSDNEQEIAVLDGDFTTREYAGSFALHGQYEVGDFNLRPKVAVTYSRTNVDAYDMKGSFAGQSIDVRFPENSFDFGEVEASGEASRTFSFSDGSLVMPYMEFGAHYEFERPNDGKITTSLLTLESTSDWLFSLRTGVRMLVWDSVFVDAGGGYLSLGQDDLDIWEAELRVAVGF